MSNEEQLLKKILYNPVIREKFKDFEDNQQYFPYYNKEEYILKLEELILQEIEKMNYETFDIELIINWVENILKDYYLNDIYIFNNGKLSDLIRKKSDRFDVEIEPYTTYISNLVADIKHTEPYEKCLDNYLTYRNYYMMNEEFDRFVHATNEREDMTEDTFMYIFNMILDKNYKLNREEYKNFFLRFCFFVAKEFGLKNPKISCNNKLEDGSIVEIAAHCQELVDGIVMDHIRFNPNRIYSDNAIENLISIFHEVQHGVQVNNEKQLYNLNVLKQIQDKILRYYLGKAYYDDNYSIVSFEVESNIASQIFLSKFLKLYAPITYWKEREKIETKLESLFLKDDDTQRVLYNKNHDLQVLFTIVLNNKPNIFDSPDILNEDEKQVLLQVYNRDCSPKTPDYYFEQKRKLLLELQNCPLSDKEKLYQIQEKIEFYDAILLTFEYSITNLKRNFLALDQYQCDNRDIMAEAFQYKNRILDKLFDSVEEVNVPTFGGGKK